MNLANMVSAMAAAAALATASSSALATEGFGSDQGECFADVVARSGQGVHALRQRVLSHRNDSLHAELTRPVGAQLLESARRHDTLWHDTAWSQREWASEPLQWSQVVQAVNALEGLWAGIGQIRITQDRVDVVLRFERPVTPVPEAGTTALMLAGLGVLAWSARRRVGAGRALRA